MKDNYSSPTWGAKFQIEGWQLQENAGGRNLWTLPAQNEVSPHFRGRQFCAAEPAAGHSRTRRPTSPTKHEQPYRFTNLGTHRAFCKMSSHLASSELGAALPPARHPWPRRSSYQIDGFRIQFRNLYANECSAPLPADPGDTSLAERESGVFAGRAAAQTGSRGGRLPHNIHSKFIQTPVNPKTKTFSRLRAHASPALVRGRTKPSESAHIIRSLGLQCCGQ